MINPLDKNIFSQLEEPEVPEFKETEQLYSPESLDKVTLKHLGDHFGLHNPKDITRYSRQLTRLVDWAKSLGAQTDEDIRVKVVGLKSRVGGSSIHDLSLYAYLEMERNKLSKQLKELSHTKK